MTQVPRHVAIIMDGNGRWAKERGLPRAAGHKAGIESVREVLEGARETGVEILTLYAFSSENWKRPKREVSFLMELLNSYLDKELAHLHREGVRLNVIGHIEALPESIVAKLRNAQNYTSKNKKLLLNVALNYGSRQEILDAVSAILEEAKKDPSVAGRLSEEFFSNRLYTKGIPDPDLLIRTSGEMRLSNFLLWQLSYAEIYITKKYWPDFNRTDFAKAVSEYGQRERRFGAVAV